MTDSHRRPVELQPAAQGKGGQSGSGIDSALFVLLAVSLMKETPLAGLALAGFLGKAAWEVATGSALFVEAGPFVPVPLAHLIGGAWGLIVGAAGRPPTSMAKLRWDGRRLLAVSRGRSGNSPAA